MKNKKSREIKEDKNQKNTLKNKVRKEKLNLRMQVLSASISDKTEKAKSEVTDLVKKSLDDEQIKKLKDDYDKALDRADEIKDELMFKLDEEEDKLENNKKFRICGIKLWKILGYFVIYSFLGFVLETIYGLLTKGVIESRQSFLYGPFCSIYGLGAVIMILGLQYFKKNNYTLFFGGYIIGSIVEYFVSLFGEMILHVKWWDYSTEPFNIGGRVCLFYSLAWGILAIYLIAHLNPKIDKFLDYFRGKMHKYTLPIIVDLCTAFLLFDCIISCIALNVFYQRLVHDYSLNIPNSEIYEKAYELSEKNEKLFNFTEKYFSNEKMLKTYPNLKMEDVNGNIVYVKDYLSDIKPYYIKLFNPENSKVHLTNVETVTYEE